MKLSKEQAEKKYRNVNFIGDYFYIGQSAVIREGARIMEGAVIRKGAEILEGARIWKGAEILEGARIMEGAVILEGALIGEGRKNVSHCICIHGIGETRRMTGFKCDEGLIITIGCMNDYKGFSYEDTEKEIAKKYDKEHVYFNALKLIKKWYQGIEE